MVYLDSDGLPIAENTVQYEWIVTIKGALDATLPDVVARDLLWYPVEGRPEARVAPHVPAESGGSRLGGSGCIGSPPTRAGD